MSRSVRIFEAFTPDETTLGISEIARRAGLHPATTSRLVAELVRHGLLAREPGRQVRIGVRMWELALRASPALSLRETAMPFMADAHAIIGHHVQLGVLDADDVIFVERLSVPHAVINYSRIAGRLPLHVSSSGLVLLAHAPGDFQERILTRPLVRYTPNTISTPHRGRRHPWRAAPQGHGRPPPGRLRLAMYCGFGRQPGKDGMETMRDHRQAALAARV